MKCQIKSAIYCEEKMEKGKEKFIEGKTCCEWCYYKTKRENKND